MILGCRQRAEGALPEEGGTMLIEIAMLAVAPGGPVYLACTLKNGDGEIAVDVTADEANQTAAVTILRTGRAVTRRALFSPEKVTIPDDNGMTWSVDRVNLNFDRVIVIGDYRSTETGRCSVKPQPQKRAF